MESKSFQLWATSSLYLLHCHIFWLCGGTTKEGRNISRTPRQKHWSFVQFLLSSHFSLSLLWCLMTKTNESWPVLCHFPTSISSYQAHQHCCLSQQKDSSQAIYSIVHLFIYLFYSIFFLEVGVGGREDYRTGKQRKRERERVKWKEEQSG